MDGGEPEGERRGLRLPCPTTAGSDDKFAQGSDNILHEVIRVVYRFTTERNASRPPKGRSYFPPPRLKIARPSDKRNRSVSSVGSRYSDISIIRSRIRPRKPVLLVIRFSTRPVSFRLAVHQGYFTPITVFRNRITFPDRVPRLYHLLGHVPGSYYLFWPCTELFHLSDHIAGYSTCLTVYRDYTPLSDQSVTYFPCLTAYRSSPISTLLYTTHVSPFFLDKFQIFPSPCRGHERRGTANKKRDIKVTRDVSILDVRLPEGATRLFRPDTGKKHRFYFTTVSGKGKNNFVCHGCAKGRSRTMQAMFF